MKSYLSALSLCAALLILVSCAGQGASVSDGAADVTMQQLMEANDFRKTTLLTHKQIQMDRKCFDASGAVIYSQLLQISGSPERWVALEQITETTDGETVWSEASYTVENATYVKDSEQEYVVCILEDQLDQRAFELQETIFSEYSCDPEIEWILSQKLQGDVRIITTGLLPEALLPYLWQDDLDASDEIEYVYECDAETLELHTANVYTVSEGGRRLLETFIFTYSDEEMLAPEFAVRLQNSTELRMITVHYEGTTQQFTVPKGIPAAIFSPEGYKLCRDAQGNVPANLTASDLQTDSTCYLLKEEQ